MQLSPSEHCPLASHCQHSPRILGPRCFCHLILNHGVSFVISIFWHEILISYILLDTSFLPSFSICSDQVLFSSNESPGRTIPIRSRVSQTLVFLICTILPGCRQVDLVLVIDNKIPSHLEIEFLNIVISKNNGETRRCSFRQNRWLL